MSNEKSIIEKTWDVVRQFISNPKYVKINYDKIDSVIPLIKEDLINCQQAFAGVPSWMPLGKQKLPHTNSLEYELFFYELVANAVNYNYWYGNSTIRPGKSSSSTLYSYLDRSFQQVKLSCWIDSKDVCKNALINFQKEITLNRFPNIENRIKHLNEISNCSFDKQNGIIEQIVECSEKNRSIEEVLEIILLNCPGYASDMFLKRAFLFIMQMYRRIGAFKDQINLIPVPTDYQIPKILKYLGCIEYESTLSNQISNQELIPRGSWMECEIRATTIEVCRLLAERAGITMCDIDTFLWIHRKDSSEPFHLTITTDY